MSDGSLSQDEIDALLAGGGGMDLGPEPSPAPQAAPARGELQGFLSLLSGLTGSLGSNLSGILGKNVEVASPVGSVVSRNDLIGDLTDQVVTLRLDLSGNTSGEHAYLMSAETAELVAGLMMGQEGVELNDAALSALEEAGTTMAGSLVTDMSDRIHDALSTGEAQTHLSSRDEVDLQEDAYFRAIYPLEVDGVPSGEIVEVFSAQLASAINNLLQPSSPRRAEAPKRAQGGGPAQGAARSSTPSASRQTFGGVVSQQANVQSVQFPSLSPGGSSGSDQGNIGLLMDVYMEMTVELGRTRKLIREILGMGEGTIIELDKLAGEPVDILVNHKLIAKGEVVVIDENFGVRVTEIVSPMDRVSDM